MAYGANRATSEITAGIGAGGGLVAYNIVGALFDGARQHRESTELARVAQVARQNRAAAVAAQARVGVLRETAADLRARLAEAEDLVDRWGAELDGALGQGPKLTKAPVAGITAQSLGPPGSSAGTVQTLTPVQSAGPASAAVTVSG